VLTPRTRSVGRPRCPSNERGSILLLFPAALLVMMVLGAIAVDGALVSTQTRSLDQLAASAANDGVSYGIDPAAVRSTGDIVLDEGRVRLAVAESLEASGVVLSEPPLVVITGVEVHVELRTTVAYIFARAIPGGPDSFVAHGSATATVVEGD
jgi:Flp pilus assembly protein TadG